MILAINGFQMIAVKSQGSQAGGLHDRNDFSISAIAVATIAAMATIAAIAEHTASIQS